MSMRSIANSITDKGRRTAVTAAAAASRSSTDTAVRYGTAGDVMLAMNQLSLGRSDPRLRVVKNCIDQAVWDTFAGHAKVQHQGSTRKGTGIAASSDWDFYVNLDDTIKAVTHKQRMAVVQQLRSQLLPGAGIDYSIHCGANRVKLWNGSDGRGVLPDVDLVFARFAAQPDKKRPKSRALAHSQVAQQVVKYIKRLPVRFTNLPEPKSSLVEKLVLKLQQQQFGNMRLTGKDGFEELLIAVLAAIAGLEGVSAPPQALQGAKVDSMNWQDAALLVLQTKQGGLGWLIV